MHGMKLSAIGEGAYSEMKCYRRRHAMKTNAVGADVERKQALSPTLPNELNYALPLVINGPHSKSSR
jgi:hypothetical protein